jgi:hypothetical protein
MSRRGAGLAKEIKRRQQPKPQQAALTLVPPPAPTPQMLADALGPRPDWCDFEPWGFLLSGVEQDGTTTDVPRPVARPRIDYHATLLALFDRAELPNSAAAGPSLLGLLDDNTQVMPVIDLVRDRSFAEVFGQVS